MGKFKKFLSNKKPGTGLYIFVYTVAMGLANIVTTLVDSYFTVTFLNSVSDITLQYIYIISSIETAIFVVYHVFLL